MADHITIDHEEIKRWIEIHNGVPALVRGVETSNILDALTIQFGKGGGDLEPIGWDEFFDIFESAGLAFKFNSNSGNLFSFIDRDMAPFELDDETMLPEINPVGEENKFPSSPPSEEDRL